GRTRFDRGALYLPHRLARGPADVVVALEPARSPNLAVVQVLGRHGAPTAARAATHRAHQRVAPGGAVHDGGRAGDDLRAHLRDRRRGARIRGGVPTFVCGECRTD